MQGTGGFPHALAHTKDLGNPPPLLAVADVGGAELAPHPQGRQLHAPPGGRAPPLRRRQASVTGSPSLTPLVPELVARANPYDLDRLGKVTGDRVKVRSARGELVLATEADDGVPRGCVAIDFNVPSAQSPGNAAATLIDSRQLVTDVRMESE